jgi:hypothetical protein
VDVLTFYYEKLTFYYETYFIFLFSIRRDGTSWGFSIVGGAEPGSDRTEPVHVLFVVPDSPAAKVGNL